MGRRRENVLVVSGVVRLDATTAAGEEWHPMVAFDAWPSKAAKKQNAVQKKKYMDEMRDMMEEQGYQVGYLSGGPKEPSLTTTPPR